MIAIVTDSTCDLGPLALARLGVHVVPLYVHLAGRQWRDWTELDPDALFLQMQHGAVATTSPPLVSDFGAVYRRLLARHDHVLSIHLSSSLSATVEHATQAAHQLGMQQHVTVYDSGFSSAPLAELILTAAQALTQGKALPDVLSLLDHVKQGMTAEFTVRSLDYLRRGGRLTHAGATFGRLLGVQPVLTFDEGLIRVDRNVRGRDALQDMLDHLSSRHANEQVNVTIAHAGRDWDRIDEIRKAVEASRLEVVAGRVQLIGAVIGAYVGPGSFGVVVSPATGHPSCEEQLSKM